MWPGREGGVVQRHQQGGWELAAERREALRRLFAGKVHLSIGEIQAELHASLATVRRDLMALELEGVLSRVHGGAIALQRR